MLHFGVQGAARGATSVPGFLGRGGGGGGGGGGLSRVVLGPLGRGRRGAGAIEISDTPPPSASTGTEHSTTSPAWPQSSHTT